MDNEIQTETPTKTLEELTKGEQLYNFRGGVSPVTKPFQSTNFKPNISGFQLKSNGEVEINNSRVRAYLSADQALLGNTEATIVFDVEDYDNYDEFNTATGIFTAKNAGYYLIYAQTRFENIADQEQHYIEIQIGTTAKAHCTNYGSSDGSADESINVQDIQFLDVGDTIRVRVRRTNAGDIDGDANGVLTFITIYKL